MNFEDFSTPKYIIIPRNILMLIEMANYSDS